MCDTTHHGCLTLAFYVLPGKPHGQRSLVGHSPRGCERVGHDLVTEQHKQKDKREISTLWETQQHSRTVKGRWQTELENICNWMKMRTRQLECLPEWLMVLSVFSLVATCLAFLVRYLFKYLVVFFLLLFCFFFFFYLLLNFASSWFIVDMCFSNTWFANIFFYSVACSFHYLTNVFNKSFKFWKSPIYQFLDIESENFLLSLAYQRCSALFIS